jgi:metallophosphoesterase (TIGR03767 family)
VNAVLRTELAPAPATSTPPTRLARLVHLTDMHVIDVRSPMRFEWIELLAADPYWWPLLHMHRPYESLAAHALAAHVGAIANAGPADLVLATGDNIDNAQRNELDAYLSLVMGGTVSLPADGSAQDARGATEWPFWSPNPLVIDPWKGRGYPAVEGFLERVAAPIRSSGVGSPFTALMGNHDLMCQGTSLFNPRLESLLGSSSKSLGIRPDVRPDDPLVAFVDTPEGFVGADPRSIDPDSGRVGVDRVSWLRAHVNRGTLGYTSDHADSGSGDTVIDLQDVRVVMLDTNHPDGDYQGSIGTSQLAWLDERLAEVGCEPGRVAVIASHHGATALVNERGDRRDRRLADAFLDVVNRHRCVVAWLVGHHHVNRIETRRGVWEITTSSTIDWPSEHRAIDISRHGDGTIEVSTTMRSHSAASGSLAALHLELAQLFDGPKLAAKRYGQPQDRDTRLFVPRWPAVSASGVR